MPAVIEILAGKVTIETLSAAIRKAKSAAWADMPDRWKTVSLNEAIGDDGGATFLDQLPDESASSDPLAMLECADEDS